MTNKDYYHEWVKDTIGAMEIEEFCAFLLAFMEGYKDGEHMIKCVDVCGHEANEDCEECAARVIAFMESERKNGGEYARTGN